MSGIVGSAGSKSGVIGTTELDYEDGSWTPEIYFGASNGFDAWNHKWGVYTKIGNLVYFSADIYPSSKSAATGDIRMPLPLTPASTAQGNDHALSFMAHRFDFDDNYGFWFINRSWGRADMYYNGANSSASVGFYNNAHMVDNTSLWLTGFYRI